MSIFDGSKEPLSYGQALCELVERVSWPSELHKREALRAVQTEHDLVPPEPDPVLNFQDSRDLTIHNQDRELAELRRFKAEAEAAKTAVPEAA